MNYCLVSPIIAFLGGSLMTYLINHFLNRGKLVFYFTKVLTTFGVIDGQFIAVPEQQATLKKVWFEFDVINKSGLQKVARGFVFIVKQNGNVNKYPAWNGDVKNPTFNFEAKKSQRIHLHTYVDLVNLGPQARIHLHYFDHHGKEKFAISEASHHNPLL